MANPQHDNIVAIDAPYSQCLDLHEWLDFHLARRWWYCGSMFSSTIPDHFTTAEKNQLYKTQREQVSRYTMYTSMNAHIRVDGLCEDDIALMRLCWKLIKWQIAGQERVKSK